jgi:hypothetical protein
MDMEIQNYVLHLKLENRKADLEDANEQIAKLKRQLWEKTQLLIFYQQHCKMPTIPM